MSRQTTTPDLLNIIENHPHHWVVEDKRIPLEPKRNIILKPSGLEHIAQYYHAKYNITIYIHTAPIKISQLADEIKKIISTVLNKNPTLKQAGLIFINDDDPDDQFGHALPMIWEREEDNNHLFFLDTTQLLGEPEKTKTKFAVDLFREKLFSLFDNLQLWAIDGCRQKDYSSCYTDALVILKDALFHTSFKTLAITKIKNQAEKITIFYMPEVLSRTVQIISLIEKSNAQLTTRIHKKYSLESWIRRYSMEIMVRDVPKRFGTFTLFKAQKYVAKINALCAQQIADATSIVGPCAKK